MMAREQDISETYNPWPKIGWATTAGIVVVSAVLGFGLLDRYQQAGPTLSVWSAICRGLGISSDTESTAEPQPTLRTPTRIAWTNATLDQILRPVTRSTARLSRSFVLRATASTGSANPRSILRLLGWMRRQSTSNSTIFGPESGPGAP
jgi:hypothetical protein